MSERGYVNLVRHLSRSTSTLPLPTLQASIAHYLAHGTPAQPAPTALCAAALSSTLIPPSALLLALRQAVHLRAALLRKREEDAHTAAAFGGVFRGDASAAVRRRMESWTAEVREGFRGARAVARLAAAGGLVLGLEDLEVGGGRERGRAEDEVVLALAEVVEGHGLGGGAAGWEADFRKGVASTADELRGALLLAAQCAPVVEARRLEALPLPVLVDVLTAAIASAFRDGSFLEDATLLSRGEGKLDIAPDCFFALNARAVTSSPEFESMALLAKFAARTITVLMESRPALGWQSVDLALARLTSLTSAVESGWLQNPLSRAPTDDDIAPGTRELATATWTILKTLLFTTLMLTQSILSAVLFIPHASSSPSSSPSPFSTAVAILDTLGHLAFVLPQFGGVASTAEGGLPELKRAFYAALDVLAASGAESERFIRQLCGSLRARDDLPAAMWYAKKAFVLACAEQLVPVLPEAAVRDLVYPLCEPHLFDPSHRETYESAHSVMLGIFASHARKATDPDAPHAPGPSFAEQIVPAHARCLVSNSAEGHLSTQQLCMAYAALVRASTSFGPRAGDALAWLCIETLLDAPRPRTQRLRLALVAAVPAVSLALLPRLLGEIEAAVREPGEAERGELLDALFGAISRDVGDAEKEFAIRWWYERREGMGGGGAGDQPGSTPVDNSTRAHL